MLESIVFYTLAAFILGFGVLVVTSRNTVHSVLFLVANFLCVAVVFVVLAAEFLAVIQVLVYAGGIVVLYLFVVMLVNLKRPPEAPLDRRRQSRLGFLLAGAVLAEITAIPRVHLHASAVPPRGSRRRPDRGGQYEGRRDAALHGLPDPVRGGVDSPARRDDRSDSARQERIQL